LFEGRTAEWDGGGGGGQQLIPRPHTRTSVYVCARGLALNLFLILDLFSDFVCKLWKLSFGWLFCGVKMTSETFLLTIAFI